MSKLISALYFVGGLLVLVGLTTLAFHISFSKYLYMIGVSMFAVAQINTPYKGSDFRMKRLRKQQIFGALALVLSGVFMFTTNGNEWIACLTIAAILELYTAFRMN